MRRAIAAILVILFLSTGTGLAGRAHQSLHHHDEPSVPGRSHDESGIPAKSECSIEAALSAPLFNAGWVPVLVLLGLFVAFLSLLQSQPLSRRPLLRLDCRGPPAAC